MKKILEYKKSVLFLILVLALALTYFFEEKRNKDEAKELSKKLSILSVEEFGNLISFSGLKLDIEKKGEQYFAKDNKLLLSEKKLDEFLTILSGLKIKKVLTSAEIKNVDRSFYIPNSDLKLSFVFEKGTLSFSLGKKLDYDQSFYMEVIKGSDKKIMIVSDESPDPNVYQSDAEYKKSEFKFQRLQMLFYLTNVFFYETKLFSGFPYEESRINFKKVDIATFRNKKFSLDFEKSVTIPANFEGLNYFEDNWISFHRVLTALEARTIYYPFASEKLTEPLSIVTIEDREGKIYNLEVYKKYGSLVGYFLKTSFNKILYELRTEEAKYFFVNIQDFWRKKIYPDSKDFSFKIQFPKTNSINFEVNISDKDIFEGTSKLGKIKLPEVKKLMDFFKMESDHVKELTLKPSEIVNGMVMKLNFANRNLGVILEENDVVVVDFDHKLELHHYVGAEIPFGIKETDYFEK